jgi:hypothetical protein
VGFSGELGGPDEKYYCTLEPGTPVTFTYPLTRASALEGERSFVPGYTYPYKVRDDENIRWWCYGRKEDVSAPPEQFVSRDGHEDTSGPPI